MNVEVCVEGIGSAVAASEAGASRIELCADLRVGGVTPSAGIIAVACRLGVPTHVLVRPRGGDFVYDDYELAVMADDVVAAKALGASGVVLGILRADGSVDAKRTELFVALASPLSVTFHKAFDETADPFEALETLVALGIGRILTSGQAPTAAEGVPRLRALTERAAGRLTVMAGGRVRETDLPVLAAAGVREVHVGSAVQQAGRTNAALLRRFLARAAALPHA